MLKIFLPLVSLLHVKIFAAQENNARRKKEQNNLFMYKSVKTVNNKMKCKKVCYYCLRIA